jgi:hypothetical protein
VLSFGMENLLLINNSILGVMLVLLTMVAILLFKHIKIFNDIHENTVDLKKDLKRLHRTLTANEKEELLKAFD